MPCGISISISTWRKSTSRWTILAARCTSSAFAKAVGCAPCLQPASRKRLGVLVLAGAPIDTDAGDGPIKKLAHSLPLDTYQEMVDIGGGRMLGKTMLAGWKDMHPGEQFMGKYVDLFAHIEDKCYIERTERFERWYENPIDLPGVYYLQAVKLLFKENRLAKGTFVGPWPQACAEGHHRTCLPSRWRVRRYHHRGASVQCREAHRHTFFRHREETCSRWSYRPLHGPAHPGRDLAGDRTLDPGSLCVTAVTADVEEVDCAWSLRAAPANAGSRGPRQFLDRHRYKE